MSTSGKRYDIEGGKLYWTTPDGKGLVEAIGCPSGRHKLVEVVGAGTFGIVYKIEKIGEEDKKMALKCSRVSLENAQIREVYMISMLARSNIDKTNILLSDFRWTVGNILFQEFPLLETTLFAKLQTEIANMTATTIRVIVKQLLSALSQLEKIFMTHADIKSNNIMLVDHQRYPWHIKLIDFGMSLHRTFRYGTAIQDSLQAISYRAPETFLWSRNYSKIDIWSIAVVMVDLLTKKFYFHSFDANPKVVFYYIFKLLGPIPTEYQKMEKYNQFVEKNGSVRKPVECQKDVAYRDSTHPYTFKHISAFCQVEGMDAQDAEQAVDLLSSILQWSPDRRPTGVAALTHPFITMIYKVDNVEYNKNVEAMRAAKTWP